MPEREDMHVFSFSDILLGCRPVTVNLETLQIRLQNSGLLIQPLVMQYGSCERHGHNVPASECTCGFHTTLNPKIIRSWTCQTPDPIQPEWTLMGIFQLVGRIAIDPGDIRAQGAFLWGFLKPDFLPEWIWRGAETWKWQRDQMPIFYSNNFDAWEDIRQAWKNRRYKLPAWQED